MPCLHSAPPHRCAVPAQCPTSPLCRACTVPHLTAVPCLHSALPHPRAPACTVPHPTAVPCLHGGACGCLAPPTPTPPGLPAPRRVPGPAVLICGLGPVALGPVTLPTLTGRPVRLLATNTHHHCHPLGAHRCLSGSRMPRPGQGMWAPTSQASLPAGCRRTESAVQACRLESAAQACPAGQALPAAWWAGWAGGGGVSAPVDHRGGAKAGGGGVVAGCMPRQGGTWQLPGGAWRGREVTKQVRPPPPLPLPAPGLNLAQGSS